MTRAEECDPSSTAMRRALEEKMKGYEYQSEFSKNFAIGYREGAQTILLIMMRSRFGDLPPAAIARVESADVPVIEQWSDRLVDAKTLADVFDEPG